MLLRKILAVSCENHTKLKTLSFSMTYHVDIYCNEAVPVLLTVGNLLTVATVYSC